MNELTNTDIEQAVIGGLLIDRRIHHSVIPLLNTDAFSDNINRNMFKAISKLYRDSEPIDTLTVMEEMRSTGIADQQTPYELTVRTGRVASSAHTEYHARLLMELYLRREMILITSAIGQDFHDLNQDVFDLINKVQVQILNITKFMEAGRNVHIMKLISEVYENAMKAKMSDDHVVGISSGYYELDHIIKGWTEPDLIIVAGRPAMGKTAFVLNLAKNACDQGKKIGIFSLEMSGTQLATRVLSMESEISAGDITSGNFDSIERSVDKVANLGIIINDTAGISAMELKASARKMVIEDKVSMIMIDYIQLMEGREKGMNREQEISKISRTLKTIAKDLKIPVMALSQLSRAVEQRSDKRPILSDLRESGAIEQDADKVMFLYRPDYYGEIEDEYGNSTRGITEIGIAKHRNGATGIVELRFIDRLTKFVNKDSMI